MLSIRSKIVSAIALAAFGVVTATGSAAATPAIEHSAADGGKTIVPKGWVWQRPGYEAISPNNYTHFKLLRDFDYNLFAVRHGADATGDAWNSGVNYDGTYGIWQEDGNLVIYRSDHQHAAWASNTAGQGNTLEIQDDGNVVIYNIWHQKVWATNTNW